jgi:hypothetical protein
LVSLGVGLLVLALVLYATRRLIAREVLTGWLRAHGVVAAAEVRSFGPGGFRGRLVVGDPNAPDFVAGDAEVSYGFRGLNFEVRTVRLTKPIVRARLHGGKLTLGSLDPLIQDLLKQPPRPDATKPKIEIDDGTLLLTTDYGPVRIVADATVADSKLMALTATTAPTRLKGPTFDTDLAAGALTLRTRGDRVDLNARIETPKTIVGSVTLAGARLGVTGQGPYPDLQKRRGDGAVTLRASLAGSLATAGRRLDGAQLSAAFDGASAGWIDTLTVTGVAQADLAATSARSGENRVGVVHLQANAPDLRWSRRGGDTVSATSQLKATLQNLVAGDLHIPQATALFAGPVAVGAHKTSVALKGAVSGRGGWAGLGAPLAADAKEIAAAKRAAQAFRFDASAVSLAVSNGAAHLALLRPVRVRSDSGAEAVLTDRGRGAWRLGVAGGGLPKVDADVSRIVLIDGGVTARGRVKAAGSFAPVEDGVIEAAGTLQATNGRVTFSASGCVPLTARKLELGANDIEALSARLCPTGAPMFGLAGGAWNLRGRAEGVAMTAPFAEVRAEAGAGHVDASGAGAKLKVHAALSSAQVIDTAPATRFNPVVLSGPVDLAGEVLTADLGFRTPAGQALGHVAITHNTRLGRGGARIDTGLLAFAEGGLQPVSLSPLAGVVGSPVSGSASFGGTFDWTSAGVTSSGVVTVSHLDFTSPAGKVTGLSGKVAFSSLSPLIAAPGQELRAESIAAFAALTGVSVAFEVQEKALLVSGGEATVGGGKVRVESLSVPLVAGAPIQGALLFEGVQLHDLVEASPFGDKVDLDAKVSGRIPFESQEGKIRILGGDLHAIQPGRLSIDRSALDAVAAGGSADLPTGTTTAVEANDTFTDFAYQAMENLAFTTLDAGVTTHDDGRLGVLFHIIGKHDPPQHQEIKLSIFDLIGRKFLGRKLPLPSNTGVDLTLDTTLNLDDLLADYADYQRLRSSAPVQTPERK